MSHPFVTVLLSVFNAEKTIKNSIESILNQTFSDFELLIINDGSTDNTLCLISEFKDSRINVLSKANTGLSSSLNLGLSLARGKYIARIDADDLCRPDRLQKQTDAFHADSDLVICGSYADVYAPNGAFIYTYKTPLSDDDIRMIMPFNNCFVHPSVMYSLDVVKDIGGYYEPIKHYFEDYVLFTQMLNYGKCINLPESLIKYQYSASSLSLRIKSPAYKTLVREIAKSGQASPDQILQLNEIVSNARMTPPLIRKFIFYASLIRLSLLHKTFFSFLLSILSWRGIRIDCK